ncbi:HEPN-associated N-terminal domain-containing protein [Niabella hibiscisoli]|uniref:HEPN-associated N-terminal domain-containing protein n=1 Tax=Niabella hibiscisoli TaxID=1825928 RepID=UPI0021D41644|nr:HEPN-associated N-terminal domain-containing protein [Niabella hibiscisoli]
MSGVMNWADELESYGLNSGPDMNVCSAHFKDVAIKSFIKRGKQIDECDYCGRTKAIRPLEEIMRFLMETVSYYFTDPVEFASYDSAEGGYLVPHRDAWEILQDDFDLNIDDAALFNDMEDWIDFNKHWADEKGMHSEGHHARPDSWSHFCYLVKHQVRYLFPAYQNELDIYSHQPLDILREIEKMVYRYGLLTSLEAGTEVIRCRQHCKDERILALEQMCAPEITHCKNPNRMSPAGISMFYCAFEVETTLKETIDKSWKQSKYTTVTFT